MYKQWVEELYSITNNGIVTLDPYGGSSGAGKIFTGSYDWHSCVHAHWTIISIDHFFARPTTMHNRLSYQNLSLELLYLSQTPNFESPYGRSWLLLLLTQMNDVKLTAFKEKLSRELIEWLEKSQFPETENIIGTHKSWMFTYFLLRLSHTLDNSSSKDLDQLFQTKFHPYNDALEVYDHNIGGITWDFIERSCLYATIKLLEGRNLSDRHITNLSRIRDEFLSADYANLGKKEAHVPGRLAMISWPFALYDQDSQFKILSKIKDHKYFYDGDFHCFSHWIPQFIWMSIYLKNIAIFRR
jgi:hypothetical protein